MRCSALLTARDKKTACKQQKNASDARRALTASLTDRTVRFPAILVSQIDHASAKLCA
jgi:hypothetical protein